MFNLYKTMHGSGLYGLNHVDSDEDWYSVVYGFRKNKQEIIGNQDNLLVTLQSFLWQAEKGVPQALEAMFSCRVVHDYIPFIRKNFVPNYPRTIDTYSRTIRGFARKETLKAQRHAIRLTLNINDLWKTGKFNPTLDSAQVDLVRSLQDVIEPEELIRSLSSFGNIDLRKAESD